MARPDPTEHAPHHAIYLAHVPEADVLPALEGQLVATLALLRSIPEDDSLLRHSPYTWSIREVVGHLSDTERIFGHRALRFARGDATPLPCFEENAYAQAAGSDRIPLAGLRDEFEATRRSNLLMLRHLTDEAWLRRGIACGVEVSVRALAYMMVGHERHHVAIVRRRLGGP